MKIRILTPEYLPHAGGGIATFYKNLAPQFAALGHDVRLYVGSGVTATDEAERATFAGVSSETLDVRRLRFHFGKLGHLAAVPGLRRHLAAALALWDQAEAGGEADIVEACDWGLSFLPAALAGVLPVVVQAHGSIGQIDQHDPIDGEEAQGVLTRLIEAAGMSRATQVQSGSRANAEFWRRQTGREIAAILPAWRAPARSRNEPALAESGLVLGRVQTWKGPRVLCEALTLLGARAPRIDWVGRDTTVGRRGRSCSALLAAEFPKIWGPLARHLPQVPLDEAARLQRASRFNIIASTWDVFNFTCVEAMASGRPVICSSGAGASELIEDGVNGFLFESGRANSLAASIDRVMALDPRQTANIAEAARETVARELDPERIAAIRLEQYESAIAHFMPRPAPADDWLRDICAHRDTPLDEWAFLDHLPLRPLLKYGARRLASKFTGGRVG